MVISWLLPFKPPVLTLESLRIVTQNFSAVSTSMIQHHKGLRLKLEKQQQWELVELCFVVSLASTSVSLIFFHITLYFLCNELFQNIHVQS